MISLILDATFKKDDSIQQPKSMFDIDGDKQKDVIYFSDGIQLLKEELETKLSKRNSLDS